MLRAGATLKVTLKSGNARSRETTGDHGRPEKASWEHGRPRGDNRGQFARTDLDADTESTPLPMPPGYLKLMSESS